MLLTPMFPVIRCLAQTLKDQAIRMNKKPSEINKWLKGNHNLTLKTLAKLEAELGEPIIYTKTEDFRNAI